MPLGVDGGAITVPLEVNEIASTFILDTGAERWALPKRRSIVLAWRATNGLARP